MTLAVVFLCATLWVINDRGKEHKRYIKNLKQCFAAFQNTSNFYRNTPLCVVFKTHFSISETVIKHGLACFTYYFAQYPASNACEILLFCFYNVARLTGRKINFLDYWYISRAFMIRKKYICIIFKFFTASPSRKELSSYAYISFCLETQRFLKRKRATADSDFWNHSVGFYQTVYLLAQHHIRNYCFSTGYWTQKSFQALFFLIMEANLRIWVSLL